MTWFAKVVLAKKEEAAECSKLPAAGRMEEVTAHFSWVLVPTGDPLAKKLGRNRGDRCILYRTS